MNPVAFLTAACLLPDHPQRRVDYWEHDCEFEPMSAACADRGIALRTVVWDDPTFNPDDYAAVIIGTTWDYAHKPQQFLAALADFESRRPLFNPLSIVRWNLDKRYLADLAERGTATVPTLWRDAATPTTIAKAFDELACNDIVVKPQIGASAWRQCRVHRGAALPPAAELPPGTTMIQPFLPAATSEGEYSFIFFGGVFSHCAQKFPAQGDYRVQSMYGGTERTHEPTAAELHAAHAVLHSIDEELLYARVDMMRGTDGRLLLMELELIEPFLYPHQGPFMGERFADALLRKLT